MQQAASRIKSCRASAEQQGGPAAAQTQPTRNASGGPASPATAASVFAAAQQQHMAEAANFGIAAPAAGDRPLPGAASAPLPAAALLPAVQGAHAEGLAAENGLSELREG